MPGRIYASILDWDNQGIASFSGRPYNLIYKAIEHFNKIHYGQYVPTAGSAYADYLQRLDDWLENVADESERRILLEFAPNIFFLGREEFLQLHQVAFQDIITRWVINTMNLRLDDPALDQTLHTELHEHTWYCPITDSMSISEFHHANGLGGIDYRPDFRSLAMFGDATRVRDYMLNHTGALNRRSPLKRIVLLEDFVGGGTQIVEAVQFATSLDPNVQVLLLPLVICPAGAQRSEGLVRQHSVNLSYSAALEIQHAHLITSTSVFPTSSLESGVQALANSSYTSVVGDNSASPRPYDPFGCWDTGATIVMYTNAPANTLAMIQHNSNTWKALFPRSARIR